jgi:hypothetical protein
MNVGPSGAHDDTSSSGGMLAIAAVVGKASVSAMHVNENRTGPPVWVSVFCPHFRFPIVCNPLLHPSLSTPVVRDSHEPKAPAFRHEPGQTLHPLRHINMKVKR